MKGLLILVFVFLVFVDFYGQSNYRFKNYTINEGLSQSLVETIVQDENYTLWIGTQDGLNKFDGKTFQHIETDSDRGLLSQSITCSEASKDGKVWFGTGKGLTLYDPKIGGFETYNPIKKTISVKSISEDKDGNIWVASESNGIFLFDLKSKKFTSYLNYIKAKTTYLVCYVNQETLLIYVEPFYKTSSFIQFNPKTKKSKTIYINPKNSKKVVVNNFCQLYKYKFLLATNQGVYLYNTETKNIKPYFNHFDIQKGIMNITDIQVSKDKTFLSTNGKGLFTINKGGISKRGKITNSTEDVFQRNALLFDNITCLFQDKSGQIWIGSERGLSHFDPKNEGFLGIGPSGNNSKGLISGDVWSFSETKDASAVFIGTSTEITRLNRKEGVFTHFKRSNNDGDIEKAEQIVLSLKVIDNNNVLAGCADGLFHLKISGNADYSYKKLDFLPRDKVSMHDRIYKIEHYKNQKYFLATKGGVVLYDFKENKSQVFEHNPEDKLNSISSGVCRLLFKDKKGRFWFSSSDGGLSYLDEASEKLIIKPYRFNNKLIEKKIEPFTSCVLGEGSVFWLGSSGSGLIKLNVINGDIKIINKKSGLPNNVIYGVLEDQNGFLWLSTNKGLCKYSINSELVKTYKDIDGLMSNEFNQGAFMKSSEGEMFFGGIYGYNYFSPTRLRTKKSNVKVVFSDLFVESKKVKPMKEGSILKLPLSQTKRIELSYKQNSFSIYFQPSDLSSIDLLKYKYVLEGNSNQEEEIGNDGNIRFNSLSSGVYTLKVYAKIGDGEWSKEPATLEIIIKAPFWQKMWFWFFVSLITGYGIFLYVKQKIDSGKKEQIKLEKKIQERTKEISAQKGKIEKQQELLKKEKKKSEDLLLNLLPESTVKELMAKGKASAKAYKSVTVMFTDVVGFTKISENMPPSRLVSKLDVMFRKFDEIIVANNLEKIKTIGDAYMCAAGVPEISSTNPMDACIAALQIQDYMAKVKYEAIANHEDFWEIRLGINTGTVTAGVIGSERLAYDVWGSTVNQAQRMEMLGEPGKVCVSGNTFKHIEPYFDCEYKGKVPTKSRGLVDMYIVKRIKLELSVNNKGLVPNEKFQEIINLHHYSSIKYYKAEKHVLKLLKKGLSKDLLYHSIDHTLDVLKAVEHLALMEGVTDEALFLLKTAAIFHDAGFVEQYENNEEIGARFAEETLPNFGFKDDHIQTIKSLIYVTEIPHKPINKLQEIICDADLDYLGTDEFDMIADRLRRELRNMNKLDSDRKWDEIQVKFLTQHKYFTETAKKTRTKKKLQNLNRIKKRLELNQYDD